MLGRSRTAAAALASLLAVGPALADPKPPTEKDKQVASDLVKKAISKSQAGDHNAAIDLYLQAFTIVPNSILLSNIGAEYQQSDRPQQALRYFCMYLDKDPSGTNAPYAAAQARALQVELGNKDVDDRDVCAKPKPRPKPRPEPTEPDVEQGVGPGGRPPRAPDPGGPTERTERADRVQKDNTLRYVGLGAGIAGAASIGVGIFAGARASSISDEISAHDRTKKWPDDIQDLQRRGQNFENLQIGTLVAGGVLITGGVILYVLSRPDASPEHTDKAALRVSPTTNGFVVFGKF
ncbi:MAG TPA: tetratricopeptide repeat protein [Kofleriaceae bacterium]|nr:tetratricopeptide repeat protein [Kofleriaceae bacterium]